MEEYYILKRCFVNKPTCFLLVWNMEEGRGGVEELMTWLLDIQLVSPGSKVIVAGSGYDKLKQMKRSLNGGSVRSHVESIRTQLMATYTGPQYLHLVGFLEVSSKTGHNITKLKDMLYTTVCNMTDTNGMAVMGRLIPTSYANLLRIITSHIQRMEKAAKDMPPLMTPREFHRLVSATPEFADIGQPQLEQMARFLNLHSVDMLLLDNMGCEKLREAVRLNAGKLWLEASGGITLQTIGDVAATGVNAISVGALTHSAKALDLGLDFVG
jgi:hypothetical protein